MGNSNSVMLAKICKTAWIPLLAICVISWISINELIMELFGPNSYMMLGVLVVVNFITLGFYQNKSRDNKVLLGVSIILFSLTLLIISQSRSRDSVLERAELAAIQHSNTYIERDPKDKIYKDRVAYVETEKAATELELRAAQLRADGPADFYDSGFTEVMRNISLILVGIYGICWILYGKNPQNTS